MATLSEQLRGKQVPSIELRRFGGLSLKADVMNRPAQSWQQLDDCDLFIDGSVRAMFGWARYGVGPTGAPYEAIFEYRPNDNAPRQIWGYCGTRGTLDRLDVAASAIPMAEAFAPGATPWVGMLPGVSIPYNIRLWTKTVAYALGDAVVKFVVDGRKFLFSCTTAGNSGANEPAWPVSGTVADGTVVWTAVDEYDPSSFGTNYAVLVGPGGPMQKFDGSSVTHVGVSAPQVQVGIVSMIQTTFAARGIAIQFGRLYAWTWFNPKTLVESSPSPLEGVVTFFATDLGSTISQPGCLLPPVPTGHFYASVLLGLPPTAATPIVGDGFTHVRIYATRDGGSTLFLVPTLYNAAGVVISDANSSVSVSDLASVPAYLPLQRTQAKGTLLGLYDGSPTSVYTGVKDMVPSGDDGAIQGISASAVVPQIPGILPSDADASALFDGYSGYISTPQQIPDTDIQSFSMWAVFQTTSTLGGPIMFFSDRSIGTTGGASNAYIYIANGGNLVFGYWNGNAWKTLVAGGNYADGNTHDVCVTTDHTVPRTALYVDGVSVVQVTDPVGTGINGFWRIGGNGLTDSKAFGAHASASEYFAGAIAKCAVWHTVVLTGAQVAALHTAAGNGTLTAAILTNVYPTHFWPLNDIGNPTSISLDSGLVLPGPEIGANNPPPENPIWATIYAGSLYTVDSVDRTRLDYSNPDSFEQFGIDNFFLFRSQKDAPITALLSTTDRLLVSTTRNLQQITGSDPASFARYPVDDYHGFVGKQLAIAHGTQLVGLVRQGIVNIDLSTQFAQETGGDHVQLGFSPLSLIGNDVQPLTKNLDVASFGELDGAVYDTTANRVLFMLRSGSPLAPAGMADEIIALQINVGFHRIAGLPPGGLRSISECAIEGESGLAILVSDANGQVWQLLSDPANDDSGALAPVAQTQALPVPEQVGVELRDTNKVFRYLWIEGTDVADWALDWSVDGGQSFRPPAKQALVPGRNGIGDEGTSIILRFTHSGSGQVALLSYLKLDWELSGQTQG